MCFSAQVNARATRASGPFTSEVHKVLRLEDVAKGKTSAVVFDDRRFLFFYAAHARLAKGDNFVKCIAFMSSHQLEAKENLRVAMDPSHIGTKDGDDVVFCAVVASGKQAAVLREKASADSPLPDPSERKDVVIKDSTQVLPLVLFPQSDLKGLSHIQDSLSQLLVWFENDNAANVLPSRQPPPLQSAVVARNHTNHSYNPRRINPGDVLCDRRDRNYARHSGNRSCCAIICSQMTADRDMKDVTVRVQAAAAIIHLVRNGDPGGRFLAKTTRKAWKEVDDTLATRWLSLVLKVADRKADEHENPRDPAVLAACVEYSMHPV